MGLIAWVRKTFGVDEVTVDDINFGDFTFRAAAAEALNVPPENLSCVGPDFIEKNKDVLVDVWKRVDAGRYKSTEADREYRRNAHWLPTYNPSPQEYPARKQSSSSSDSSGLMTGIIIGEMMASANNSDPSP